MAYDARTGRDEPTAVLGYYCQYCLGNATTISHNRVRYVTVLHAPDCELYIYLRTHHPKIFGPAVWNSPKPQPADITVPFLPPR